jgi:hypothetical protein
MQKRPYTKPALRRYGTVAALTQAAGMMSTMADGGSMVGMNKTR